jgi:hypothetical protein
VTIAISVKTATAVIFAADSKLTTYGRVGYDTSGAPVIVPQTYDNATKIVQDAAGGYIAVVTGSVSLGRVSFMDYIASSAIPGGGNPDEHDAKIREFAQGMANLRAAYWNDVELDRWPDTVLLLASRAESLPGPVIWRLGFVKKDLTVQRVTPGIYLEGSCREVSTLLYGFDFQVFGALSDALVIGGKPLGFDGMLEEINKLKILRPIERINTSVMPVQDAIELAYFLASAQVQMDRFLPGDKACGGPIDVMVLKTAPGHEILWHPGKQVHHPGLR